MSKPKVTTNPVANQYAGRDARIIEYSHNGVGGLISLQEADAGLSVHLYRHDPNVHITVEREEPKPPEIIVMLVQDELSDDIEDSQVRLFCPHCGGSEFYEEDRADRWNPMYFGGDSLVGPHALDLDDEMTFTVSQIDPQFETTGFLCQSCTQPVSLPDFLEIGEWY